MLTHNPGSPTDTAPSGKAAPSALPAAQAVGPGAALLTRSVPLPHPTAHASHPLPLGPASHSAIHTQDSTVPSPPGFSQTHLGLALPANLAPLASLPHLDRAGASPVTCSQPHW